VEQAVEEHPELAMVLPAVARVGGEHHEPCCPTIDWVIAGRLQISFTPPHQAVPNAVAAAEPHQHCWLRPSVAIIDRVTSVDRSSRAAQGPDVIGRSTGVEVHWSSSRLDIANTQPARNQPLRQPAVERTGHL
jgi:hypothetical protein